MLVTGTVKTCADNRCQTTAESDTYTIPAGMTGDWTLDTDITAVVNKLSGTGALTLSNGRVLTYQITGSYKATSEVQTKLDGQAHAAERVYR